MAQWEIVQEKAFTAWLNETLAHRGMHVDDIRVDLGDGLKLLQFFEILSEKKVQTKIEAKPTNRIQKIQNLHIALKFLENEMGFRNPGCSAEDIADAATNGIKLVLGLLWTLYRKFRIAVITVQDKSSEEGLLLWVKAVTDGYNGVNIDTFKNSFKDGMAFLAMVHRFNPEKTKVKYDDFNAGTPDHNLQVAFDLAEAELGIPKLLDVKEVMDGKVDERSLVLYTSLFFHAFKANQVAQDLQHQKKTTELTLQQEKKRNEELEATNRSLIEELEALRLEFNALKKKHEETVAALEKEKSEALQRLHEQTTTNLQLTKTLEEERVETTLKIADLTKKNQKLEDELSENKKHTKFLEDSVSAQSKDSSEREIEADKHIQELRKKHGQMEEEIEALRNEVDNFKSQLEQERKENRDHKQALQERTQSDSVHRRGLQVLHKNLDEHIVDLHSWQKYLNNTDYNFLDFERDIAPSLNADLEGKDFVDELNLLSGKLEAENDAILKLLKVKQAEAHAASKAKAAK